MKNKIINSTFDPDTGTSKVTIQNKYGKFNGSAFCHPNDMDNFSMFAGERYAEVRAAAKFAKTRLKQEKIKLKTIQNLVKDIEYGPYTSMEHLDKKVRKLINLKLRDYSQAVEDWNNYHIYLQTAVKHMDEQRQELLAKYRDKNKGN